MAQTISEELAQILCGFWIGDFGDSGRSAPEDITFYLEQCPEHPEIFVGGGTCLPSFKTFSVAAMPTSDYAPEEGRNAYLLVEVKYYWDTMKILALRLTKRPGWWVMSGMVAITPIDSDVKQIVMRRCNEKERDALREEELRKMASDN